jgi:hypothetical protein
MLPTFYFDADADPDPAFHFNLDTDPASQNYADPDPQHCLNPKFVIADPDIQIPVQNKHSWIIVSVSTFFSPKSKHRAFYKKK